MIARRLCASATPGEIQIPSPSGPRWHWARTSAATSLRRGSPPSHCTMPPMPHISAHPRPAAALGNVVVNVRQDPRHDRRAVVLAKPPQTLVAELTTITIVIQQTYRDVGDVVVGPRIHERGQLRKTPVMQLFLVIQDHRRPSGERLWDDATEGADAVVELIEHDVGGVVILMDHRFARERLPPNAFGEAAICNQLL